MKFSNNRTLGYATSALAISLGITALGAVPAAQAAPVSAATVQASTSATSGWWGDVFTVNVPNGSIVSAVGIGIKISGTGQYGEGGTGISIVNSGGLSYGVAAVNSDGSWTATTHRALPVGTYTLYAKQVLWAGDGYRYLKIPFTVTVI